MNGLTQNEQLIKIGQKLLDDISCDFVGIAIQNNTGPDVRWHFALGNKNDKYKRITVRYGKGIAGRVVSTGRPMEVVHFPNQIIGKALEYPIMLAEKLVSSYAVPILFQGIPKGVLLVGRRYFEPFQVAEQKLVLQFVQSIQEIVDGK